MSTDKSSKVKRILNRNDRIRSSITFPTETMAKQSFKDECNINNIILKYDQTGLIDHVNNIKGSYGDFTSVQDYQLSLNQVIEAQDAFDHLPAKIRKRFANSPTELMAFLADPANTDEAIKLGLVVAPDLPPPEPNEAPPAPPKKDPPAKPESAQ